MMRHTLKNRKNINPCIDACTGERRVLNYSRTIVIIYDFNLEQSIISSFKLSTHYHTEK